MPATAPDVMDEENPAQAGLHGRLGVPDLEDVFRQHASLVYRTARALTGSAEEAEDIVQTVFLRLLRGDATALRKNPKGYLYRAAVNLSLDVLRARRRRPFIRDVGDLEASTPAAPGFGTHAYHQLDDALAQLDPRSVEILTLRYVHGYNDADIARMLGVSRGAMAGRLFRLRRRLYALLRGAARGEKQ
ncbi:MAG: RNA polymerase sigma factor [Vicinamibacterales bacterium]